MEADKLTNNLWDLNFTSLDFETANEKRTSIRQGLMADINVAISKRTEIVVVGNNAGPVKLKKIEELQAQGYPIRLVHEPEFLNLILSTNMAHTD